MTTAQGGTCHICSAAQSAFHQSDSDPGLAGRRAGQELAERDDVGEGVVAKPFPSLDEFGAEVAEMGDRAAETRQAEAQESQKDRR